MRKVKPDKQKALALQIIAKNTLKRLSETNTTTYPTNTLIDYYECIRKLIEAICCLEGVKFDGEEAHKLSINHIHKIKLISESERIFLQDLRNYRNRVNYEGLFINIEFIQENEERIKEIINKLNVTINK